MNFLANFLTSLSLLSAFGAIIFSLESHFTFACWAIIFSVIFDGLDGQVARRNASPSNFGKELDSLADVIAFGMAPAVLGYIFIYREFHFLTTLALFVYLYCSVIRLAKYNITPKGSMINYFYGLPTTVSGGILASFILIYRKGGDLSELPAAIPYIFLFLVLLLSFLMVSKIRYLNLDGIQQVLAGKTRVVILVLLGALMAAILLKKAGSVLFSIFLIYLIFSPFVVKRMSHRRKLT